MNEWMNVVWVLERSLQLPVYWGRLLAPSWYLGSAWWPTDNCVILGLWSPLSCDLRKALHWDFFFFLACGILVPQAGIEPETLAVRAQSPNHRTTSPSPHCNFLFHKYCTNSSSWAPLAQLSRWTEKMRVFFFLYDPKGRVPEIWFGRYRFSLGRGFLDPWLWLWILSLVMRAEVGPHPSMFIHFVISNEILLECLSQILDLLDNLQSFLHENPDALSFWKSERFTSLGPTFSMAGMGWSLLAFVRISIGQFFSSSRLPSQRPQVVE